MAIPRRVIITGGGTGGHIYPALTIAKVLTQADPQTKVGFIGGELGLEGEIIPREGYEFHSVPVVYLSRKIGLSTVKTVYRALKSLRRASRIIREFKPQVVVGTGGYVSGPVVLAAVLQGIPTIIQEQNAYPGLTTRLLAPRVQAIALAYEAARPYLKGKGVVTGNPIRPEILTITRQEARVRLGLGPEERLVLATGGSQGARRINQALLPLYSEFRSGLRLIHLTGAKEFPSHLEQAGLRAQGERASKDGVEVMAYTHEMPTYLAAADLIIGRAGAISLAELTAKGVPAILIPYPHSAEGHQEENARVLTQAGAALVIPDEQLTSQTLSKALGETLRNPQRLAVMAQASKSLGRPKANQDILEMLSQLVEAQD